MTEQAAPTPQPGTPSSQPGAPVPPPAPGQGMGPAPQGMGPAPQAPSKRSGFGKRIVVALIVAVVAAGGSLAWKFLSGDPSTASVGDCMAGTSEKDLKTVKCDDAKAQHKVVGKLENKTEAEFKADDNPCTAFPTAESAFWEGKSGGKGYILCLEPVKK